MAERFRVFVVLAAVLLVVSVPALEAQSASASMSVSVTVVRSCSVAAPSGVASPGAGEASVRLSCGRSPSSTPLMAGAGVVPVAGAPAAAHVATSRGADGVVVSVNF